LLGPKQTTAAFEKALWKLLAEMAKQPVSDAELRAAKRNMIAANIFAQDSLYLRAKEIGHLEVVGIGAANRDAWLDAIKAVTAHDIQQAVSRWLQPDRATTGILMPVKKPASEVKS
jgi:zinc protease